MNWFYWALLGMCSYWLYALYKAMAAARESRRREMMVMLRLLACGAGLSALSCVFRLFDAAEAHRYSPGGFVCSIAGSAALWLGWVRLPKAMAERSELQPATSEEVQLRNVEPDAVLGDNGGICHKPLSGLTYLVFKNAEMECQKRGMTEIDTDHLLLGLLNERCGICRRIVTNILHEDVDIRNVLSKSIPDEETARELSTPYVSSSRDAQHLTVAVSRRAMQALEYAGQEAHRFKSPCIRTEHLFLGVLLTGTGVGTITLFQHGVTVEAVRNQTMRLHTAHSVSMK